MNVFSVVIGILATFAILIFVFARYVGSRTQERQVLSETEYIRHVEKHVAPFQREAVAGETTAAMTAPAASSTASAGGSNANAIGTPTTGKALFEQTCSACHGPGIAGAPKAGDKAAWAPHLAKGLPTLYAHALHGFHGSKGVMPAKGGRPEVPNAVVKRAVNYMVSLVDPKMVKGKPR